jgi:hypothetical protein
MTKSSFSVPGRAVIGAKRALVALVLIASFATLARGGEAEKTRPRVLILHLYHVGFTWSDNITSGIRSKIRLAAITDRFTGEGLAGFIQEPYVKEMMSKNIREILDS